MGVHYSRTWPCLLCILALFVLVFVNTISIDFYASFRTSRNETDDTVNAEIVSGEIGQKGRKFSLNKDATTIAYDEYQLLRRLKEIHDYRYSPPINETCTKRLPNCVILGMRKCGTQELIDFLSLHPNIVRRGKPTYEINCFLSDEKLKSCKNLMPCSYSDQLTVTKSSIYLTTPSVPERLYLYNSSLKMILLVREPLERMIADYSFELLQKRTKADRLRVSNFSAIYENMNEFDKHVIDPVTGQVRPSVPEIVRSTYDVGMERYLNFFKREQILVIESKEFKTSPVDVLRRVEAFLGLDHMIEENDFVFNAEKGFYCVRSNNGMNCYGDNRGRNMTFVPKLRVETKQRLRTFFKEHNEKFFELISKRYDW